MRLTPKIFRVAAHNQKHIVPFRLLQGSRLGAQYDLGRIYQKHGLNYDFKRDKAKRNYLKMNKEMSDNIFYALVCILLVVIGHVTSQLFTNPFSSESIAAWVPYCQGTSSVFLGVLGIKTMRVWKTQSTSNDLSELLYLMHKIKLLSSEIATQNSVINLELDERIDSRLSHQDLHRVYKRKQ